MPSKISVGIGSSSDPFPASVLSSSYLLVSGGIIESSSDLSPLYVVVTMEAMAVVVTVAAAFVVALVVVATVSVAVSVAVAVVIIDR